MYAYIQTDRQTWLTYYKSVCVWASLVLSPINTQNNAVNLANYYAHSQSKCFVLHSCLWY